LAFSAYAGLSSGAWKVAAKVIFVYRFITVVVEPVTDLGDRSIESFAEQAATDAVQYTRGALAKKARRAVSATAGIVLIDPSVAVIVLAVAHLDRGIGGGATDQRALDADGLSKATVSFATGHRARETATWVRFVDLTITVIVATIADLIARLFVACARQDAALAAEDPRSTDP